MKRLAQISFVKWQVIALGMIVFTALGSPLWAQPENPSFGLSSSTFFEVDMQSIALVDIESFGGNKDFSLSIPLITEAGNPLGANPLATNNNNWLNYSCAVPVVISRRIEVNLSAGTLPPHFEVQLTVGPATGSGGGNLGVPPGGALSLSVTPQIALNGIRGAFTGDGAGNGHRLTYELHYNGNNFHLLEQEDITLTVQYTIMDN